MSNTSASPSKTRTVIDIDDSSDSGGGEDDGEVTFVASRPPPGQPTAASSTSSSPSKRRDGAESSTIEGAQTGLCTQAEGENRAGADELASVVHDVNPPSIASTSSSGRQSSSHAVVVLTSRGPGANLQLQPINTYQRPPSLDQQRGAGAAGAAPLYTVDRERHTITIHATDADRSYWPVREYISGGRVLVRNIAMDGSETARQWSIRCGTGLARLLELGGDDDDAGECPSIALLVVRRQPASTTGPDCKKHRHLTVTHLSNVRHPFLGKQTTSNGPSQAGRRATRCSASFPRTMTMLTTPTVRRSPVAMAECFRSHFDVLSCSPRLTSPLVTSTSIDSHSRRIHFPRRPQVPNDQGVHQTPRLAVQVRQRQDPALPMQTLPDQIQQAWPPQRPCRGTATPACPTSSTFD